jgi:uncharacterized membrane protein
VSASPLRSENLPTESVVEMARLSGLSDAVFAVALTLLVLDIRLPDGLQAGELLSGLLALAPRLLVYLVSFVIIGGAWGSHQRMLGQIKRGDGPLVWLNLFSLLFVTLLPASAALLGRFPTTFVAVLCFAVDVIMIQLTAWLMWRHASRHNLITPVLDPRVVTGIGRRLSLSGITFTLSIPLALLNTSLVYGIWIALFVLLFTTDWLSWQQAIRTEVASIPLNGAARARIDLVHGGGQLKLQAGPANGELIRGEFGGGLDAEVQREGDTVDLRMIPANRRGFMSWRFPWAWSRANALDWNVFFHPEIPIELELKTAGGQSDLDFSLLQMTKLNLTAGSSSTVISLPAHVFHLDAVIEAGASSLIINLPPGVAAWIALEKRLTSIEIDLDRFVILRDGREYRTRDYETAINRVDLHISMAIGSIKVC